MDVIPLTTVDLSNTDEELGWWLVATWVGHHALKAGYQLNEIPPAWAERLIEDTGKLDSDSVRNAALESMFRKACAGHMETAGKMLREHLRLCAVEIAKEKAARTGAKVRKPFAEHNRERGLASATAAATWQAQAAALWAMPQHANKTSSDIARLIDPEQWNTIRRKIKKP
ncbi:hypothetical protein ABQJ54_02120 [Rhodanobacter sp. Si-c]|uniref:Uncharacterized protein n=1 Tax=Rhodanobacter lycopersici TaxID=3162487 RepID=A0ABV3QB32_9GAMM